MASYRILCIDGGGIRGLLASILIQRLLEAVPDFLERADLLAGTSTGGIIVLSLARGTPIDEIVRLYATHGKEIFAGSTIRRVRELGGLVGSSDNAALKAILGRVLGRKTLGGLHKRVLIPTFELDNGGARGRPRMWKPKFFHNFPGPNSDRSQLARDVALRTSAAPTYFPAYQGFIDGGVVANNPSMSALAQALDRATGQRDLDEIGLLSIGTGINPRYIEQKSLDWGSEQWTRPLVSLMMDGMAAVVDYQCTRLLGDRYHRLARVLPLPIGLDDVERIDDLVEFARDLDLSATLAWLKQHWLGL